MKKHIFFGGGRRVGGGGERVHGISRWCLLFWISLKKIRGRLDKAGSAINVAFFRLHFGWILLDLYESHAPENALNVG